MKCDIIYLRPGMTLLQDVYNSSRVCILKAGTTLTEKYIDLLQKHFIDSVFVSLSKEERKKRELDQDVVETIPKQLKEEIILAQKSKNAVNIINYASVFTKKIIKSNDLKYSLSQYLKNDDDIFKKSVRIALYSVFLANEFNKKLVYTHDGLSLEVIAQACLLRDLGVSCQDPKELAKIKEPKFIPEYIFTKIDKDCFKTYNPNMNTLYSYNILGMQGNLSNILLATILSSREQPNGDGPLGAIPKYMNASKHEVWGAKIIKLCEEYDNILSMVIKSHEGLLNVKEVLEHYAIQGIVDKDLVKLLLDTIPLYSPGCKVQLSDERYALVIQRTDISGKPIVKIVSSGELIDLRESTSLVIKCIVDESVSFYDIAGKMGEQFSVEAYIKDEEPITSFRI